MRMGRLGQEPVGPEVDVEDAVPGRDIEIDQLAGRGDTGITDDGIDAAHRLHGGGHQFGGLAGPGHIGLERTHLAACRPQVRGERLEFIEIGHVTEGERLRAIGGELQRRGTADAAAGASNHDPHRCLPSRLASPILWGRCPRRGRRGKATDDWLMIYSSRALRLRLSPSGPAGHLPRMTGEAYESLLSTRWWHGSRRGVDPCPGQFNFLAKWEADTQAESTVHWPR